MVTSMTLWCIAGLLLGAAKQSAAAAVGCYSMTTHRCDCDASLTNATCTGRGDIWQKQCRSCASNSTMTNRSTLGCYNKVTHKCDCTKTQTSCAGMGSSYTWTSGCSACGTSTSKTGCYHTSTHKCDCQSTKTACAAMGAGYVWTTGCTTCHQASAAKSGCQPSAVLLAMMLLVPLACAAGAEAEAGGAGAAGRAAAGRRLGVGCYDQIDSHRCDCTMTEQQCQAKKHTWTDGCRSCDAASGVHHPQCPKDVSWGCFDSGAHRCECSVSESACEKQITQNKSWTRKCWSCCHKSSWGCFVPGAGPGTGCHCGIAEGACKTDFPGATWSHQCHVCSEDDKPKAEEDDDGVHPAVRIVGICAVTVCCLGAFVSCVTCYYLRSKAAKAPGFPPEGQGNVVLGAPVEGAAADPSGNAASKAV